MEFTIENLFNFIIRNQTVAFLSIFFIVWRIAYLSGELNSISFFRYMYFKRFNKKVKYTTITDPETGVSYLTNTKGGVCPRLDPAGHLIVDKSVESESFGGSTEHLYAAPPKEPPKLSPQRMQTLLNELFDDCEEDHAKKDSEETGNSKADCANCRCAKCLNYKEDKEPNEACEAEDKEDKEEES